MVLFEQFRVRSAYSKIGIVGINQKIVRSRATVACAASELNTGFCSDAAQGRATLILEWL